MSVLKEPYAVPSRVIGIYRYLLQARGQSESLEMLTKVLAPESLPRREDRDADADDEGEGSGQGDGPEDRPRGCRHGALRGRARGHDRTKPRPPAEVRTPGLGDSSLPVTIADLMFARENSSNHDFGQALAWYLCQDVYRPPGNWNEFDEALRSRFGGDRLGITNSNPYAMLEDWACYLGFAWLHSKKGKNTLTPDPTAHIRLRLSELFPGEPGRRHAFSDVMQRLAHVAPVFEGGFLRAEAERVVPRSDPRHLSTATAQRLAQAPRRRGRRIRARIRRECAHPAGRRQDCPRLAPHARAQPREGSRQCPLRISSAGGPSGWAR